MDRRLTLGSRASPLALAQAREAADAIAAANGWDAATIDIVALTTTGDRIQDRPLAELGGKALWTKELDRALASGTVDACVHSMKDVESERSAVFHLAAILPRADVRDRLIGAGALDELAIHALVGSSSPRRAAQLLRARPDLRIVPLRGNVQTRLNKVAAGEVAATLLAAAGLDRLGLSDGVPIDLDQLLPAPGQAAIGIECRADDARTVAAIRLAADRDSLDCVLVERAFTAALGATCRSPVAALARPEGAALVLRAELYSADGKCRIAEALLVERGDLAAAAELARAMLERAPGPIRALFDPA